MQIYIIISIAMFKRQYMSTVLSMNTKLPSRTACREGTGLLVIVLCDNEVVIMFLVVMDAG